MAVDTFGRRIDYLRISVTDGCNLRCIYCMPEGPIELKDRADILTFEEIERFSAAAAAEGISKIRLTGGEPLVRRGLVDLVGRLRAIPGIEAIALTTNGTLLPRMANDLMAAGIDRVNISIDSLDPDVYRLATRGGKLEDGLAGIDAALAAGMSPVKLNVVMMRSLNQDLAPFAKLTMDRPVHVRFIEYMPVGGGDDCLGPGDGAAHVAGVWTKAEHVSSDETMARLVAAGAAAGLGALEPVDGRVAPSGWGPARYFRFEGAKATVGFISPLSYRFCGECNRLRLTADGKVRTCLFSDDELDARRVLRHGSRAELHSLVLGAVAAKPEWHNGRIGTLRRMSQVGG
jgi:cyclic pyranopterin phosphate synthase